MALIKELQTSLLARLSEEVEKYGFDKKVKGQSFYKKTPFGRLAFHISFIRHHTDVDVTANVSIRYDDLEELVNEQKEYLSKAEKKNTFSLGAELGNISEGRQRRWTVAGFDDNEDIALSIMSNFTTIGIPYLEKYSDMETALEVLRGEDKAAWFLSPFDDERAMRAVGLAFLLGPEERFLEICAAKTDYLASKKSPGLERFLRLKEELGSRFGRNDHVTKR